MRVRARYTKSGKLRFISAIDLGRVWERSLRLADLPIAYSEGFSPHPKVSFPDALPLGYASTGEYAELTFAAPVVLDTAVKALNAAFPAGLEILLAVPVADGDPKLSSLLQASTWDLQYRADDDTARRILAAVDALRAADEVPVARQRKGAPEAVDMRPAVAEISAVASTDGVTVRVTLHHIDHLPPGAPPVALRPSEVHAGLEVLRPALPDPVLVTRVAQGRALDRGLAEALSGEHVPPLS